MISRGGSLYAQTLLGVKIQDLTGGFKCFRAEVLRSIDLETVRSRGYAFQVELTYRAIRRGFRGTSENEAPEIPRVTTSCGQGIHLFCQDFPFVVGIKRQATIKAARDETALCEQRPKTGGYGYPAFIVNGVVEFSNEHMFYINPLGMPFRRESDGLVPLCPTLPHQ